MARISVKDLKPGQTFSKPVYYNGTNTLAGAHIPITVEDIERIVQQGVQFIETEGEIVSHGTGDSAPDVTHIKEEYEILIDSKEEFQKLYRESVETLKGLFDSLRFKKPFNNNDALKMVESLIEILGKSKNSFIFIPQVDAQNEKEYLVFHSLNVCIYSLVQGYHLNLSKMKLQDLGLGAVLADAGMLTMPDSLLEKTTDLTPEEQRMIKTHPVQGFKLLNEHAKVKQSIAQISMTHQENFDGSGYPKGLSKNDIPEYARIVAIADHFDAQVRPRPYRKKKLLYESMKNLLTSEVSKLDPVLLKKFLNRMSIYPIGSLVRLNNELVGIVIAGIQGKPMRPALKVVVDEFGEPSFDARLVSLIHNKDLYIVREVDRQELDFPLDDVL
jgi:HD-GYP domain-containing protein (c-di-GMP phosphodiesterase class II)